MKIRTLRLRIVSAGIISRKSRLPAALSFALVDFTAIVDTELVRDNRFVRTYGFEVAAAGLIAEVAETIDAAIVASMNDTHANIAKYCVKRSIYALAEKLPPTTVEDGIRITEVVNSGKAVLAVG